MDLSFNVLIYIVLINKAVYMTASVAYRWVGAVKPFKQFFSKNFKHYGWTDGWTNGRMD